MTGEAVDADPPLDHGWTMKNCFVFKASALHELWLVERPFLLVEAVPGRGNRLLTR